jgi:hypothetical protein
MSIFQAKYLEKNKRTKTQQYFAQNNFQLHTFDRKYNFYNYKSTTINKHNTI